MSCPARGTWIEIWLNFEAERAGVKSCPARGTWIEIRLQVLIAASTGSCPARGTWIEMAANDNRAITIEVVPRKGHVD